MARAAAILFTSTFARSGLALLALFCTACGRYADFTLPALPSRSAAPKHLKLTMQPNPVIEHGPPGAWDSSDALNPSVVEKDGRLFNFYSGFDGSTWHTGLAESADGLHWTKHPSPVLSPARNTWESNYIAANGSAHVVAGEFWYWYQSGNHDAPEIGFARSRDGVQWTKYPKPVLTHGPRGSFDESATADPYVIRLNGTFYLYYLGQNRARQQRLGLARSKDGITWEKLRSNPLLELPAPGSKAFDENGQGEPAVFLHNGLYWMLWTGRDAAEHRALGLASSSDGVHWQRSDQVFPGTETWNKAVLADPTVLERNGHLTLWFGGGDQPSPDERLHGQIGMGSMQEDPQ